MSKKDLQKEIKVREGLTFSTDTLNLHHLLAQAYDLMVEFKLRTPLKGEILKAFDYQKEKPLNNCLIDAVFYGRELTDEYEASLLWNDVCDYFETIAPAGYSFMCLEGDGANIGWYSYII